MIALRASAAVWNTVNSGLGPNFVIEHRRDPDHRHIAGAPVHRQPIFAIGRQQHFARIFSDMHRPGTRLAWTLGAWLG
jgi:hypothetical protein